MNGHTPGPWMVCDGPVGYQHRIFNSNEGGDTVCDVVKSRDARLIAAAPELLEALRLCFDHCRLYHREAEHNNVGEAVRAAITKATGAQP